MENNEMSIKVCENCGNEIDEMSDYYDGNDECLCESCFHEQYGLCEYCGEYHLFADMVPIDGIYANSFFACEDCANRNCYFCDECEEWYTDRHIWTTGRRCICDSCSDDYFICSECDDVYHVDNGRYDEDEGEWYCDSCYEEHRRYRTTIQGYGYKPAPKFGFRSTSQNERQTGLLTYGVELEVDRGDDAEETAREVQDVTDMVYIKHDGSLDCGFEIVSHPCTLDYHSYSMNWKHMAIICRHHGFRSHDVGTCGLHVHVGRRQFGTTNEERAAVASRVIMLVNKHWDKMVTFSRRTSRQLDEWARPVDLSGFDYAGYTDADMEYNAYAASRATRYLAVNVWPSETIEFRLFRGTLTRDTLIAAIQLCDNICKYAMAHTASECWASTWQDVSRHATYKELCAYLDSKQI